MARYACGASDNCKRVTHVRPGEAIGFEMNQKDRRKDETSTYRKLW